MDDAVADINTSESGSVVSNNTVILNPRSPHTSTGTHLSRLSPSDRLVRITLKEECLVNTIELEGSPCGSLKPFLDGGEVAKRDIRNETFSYKIFVSKDGKEWLTLFNFSEYNCHSIQKLNFPALAFRQVAMNRWITCS